MRGISFFQNRRSPILNFWRMMMRTCAICGSGLNVTFCSFFLVVFLVGELVEWKEKYVLSFQYSSCTLYCSG